MILTYGTPAQLKKLQGQNWHYIELRSEHTVENTLRRIGDKLLGIFRNEAVEVFVPVTRRDLDVFELETSVYVYIRSTSFPCVIRLKSVTGVVSLVTEGDMNRPSRAIAVPDKYVQERISVIKTKFFGRAEGIKAGSFVRIIDGETRDYCGHVLLLSGTMACVKIDLKTKSLLIETPIRNLLNLPNVPDNQRVFYHCPLVKKLAEDGKVALITEDLKFSENANMGKTLPEIQLEPEQIKRYSRQRTVTALVKRLVTEGMTDPIALAKEVIVAIKKKDIKTPKNLLIIYCIIKDALMRVHFMKKDPKLENYRDVIRKHGKQYKFSPSDIAALDRTLGVPIMTLDPAKDGRSRSAREQKRQLRELEQEQKAVAAAEPKKRKTKLKESKHEQPTHFTQHV
jgi:hypothetical protein